MNYYLVGIKGSGMSALASLLYDMGHEVIGSDVTENFGFETGLTKRKIKILEYSDTNITQYQSQYIYIIGNSQQQNIETKMIINSNYQYYYYHEFVGKIEGIKIAVSGTHGKTTTTKLITHLLREEKIAYLIGDGTGAATPDYQYFIFEACEYKNHFLSYFPDILLITNIEHDHPDFFNSLDDVIDSFERLKKQSHHVIEIAKLTYQIVKSDELGFTITVDEYTFTLPFTGIFMIENFLGARMVLKCLGYKDDYIQKQLIGFEMPKRRSEIHQLGETIIVFDYGHHPSEIKALHQSLTQRFPSLKKYVIFQPHTYARTSAFKEGFIKSLSLYDEVYIAETFVPSREEKNKENEHRVNCLNELFFSFTDYILNRINPSKKEVWVFLGAGIIHQKVIPMLKKE